MMHISTNEGDTQMDYNDPIDADRMLVDAINYGTQAQDAIDITDPFLTPLAIIGELAGMRAVECILDVLEDDVANFSRDRVIEMNDDYATYYKRVTAERYARLIGRAA
jgi:hypothetical protein